MKGKLFTLIALIAGVAPSHGAVTNYGLSYYADYEQASDAQPGSLLYAAMSSMIAADTNGDLLSASLSTPLNESLDFYDASYNAGTYFLVGTALYPSIAELEAAYPDGTYTFDITGGAVAPQTAFLNVIPADFADTIPYLEAGTFSAMQYWPSGTDAPVAWPTFGHAGGASTLQANFYLYDYTNNTLPWYASGDETSTGSTIPGSSMVSGHYYGFVLEYLCYTDLADAGFGNATGFHGYSRRTSGLLHCKADPGTVAGKLTLSDFYNPSGQTVRVQVIADDGTIEDEQDVVLGSYGYYAFDTASTGTKRITFKGSHWLRLSVPGVDLDTGQDALNPVLINGDVDGDNAVTVFDYNLLSDAFDSVPGDANWNDMADLDGDLSVTVFDYNVLSASFDLVGDE